MALVKASIPAFLWLLKPFLHVFLQGMRFSPVGLCLVRFVLVSALFC
jgi:hypothetical protein